MRDMDAKIADSLRTRAQHWHRDVSSAEAYERRFAANRTPLPANHRARRVHGCPCRMERFGDEATPALVAETPTCPYLSQVRWPVLPAVHGEGLLLEPKQAVRGGVVALPDADQRPEQFCRGCPGVDNGDSGGITDGAAIGGPMDSCVVVPMLLDRRRSRFRANPIDPDDEYSAPANGSSGSPS